MGGFFLLGFFMIVVGIPVGGGMIYAYHEKKLKLREKELQVLGSQTAERAAQYAAQTERLENRVRVLERIITDKGLALSDEIEALRDHRVN